MPMLHVEMLCIVKDGKTVRSSSFVESQEGSKLILGWVRKS